MSPEELSALPIAGQVAWWREQIKRDPSLAQDADVVRELGELDRLLERNPLQLVEPYPKQAEFLESRDWIKAFFGGNGAGKTFIGIVDDLIQLCDRDAVPERLRRFKRWEPPVYIRVMAPKLAVIEGVILEKFRQLTPKDQLAGGKFEGNGGAYDKQNRKLHFANGSWVIFNTYDQDRDAHAGVELHRAHFDEEPEGEHGWGLYIENVARLRRFAPDAQAMFTMTPLFGMSWTFDEVWERREEPGVFCTVASMRDNPHIDAESMIRALSSLSDAEKQAVIEGKFVSFHGRVIEVGEDRIVDPIKPSHLDGLDVYVGIDPGVARGGVVWAAFDRDNHMLIFDELYPSGLSIPALADLIREKNREWGIEPLLYVIDPSARNRSLTDAESVETLFAREGIYTTPGTNDRRTGVLQLRARLESKALTVTRNCEAWVRESRRWLVASDELTGESKAKVKGAGGSFATVGPDHVMDPTRYLAMYRLWYVPPGSEKRRQGWMPGSTIEPAWVPDTSELSDAPLGAMG